MPLLLFGKILMSKDFNGIYLVRFGFRVCERYWFWSDFLSQWKFKWIPKKPSFGRKKSVEDEPFLASSADGLCRNGCSPALLFHRSPVVAAPCWSTPTWKVCRKTLMKLYVFCTESMWIPCGADTCGFSSRKSPSSCHNYVSPQQPKLLESSCSAYP